MISEESGKLAKKRLGRPPAPRELARNNRVVTFVTDAELQIINKVATQKQLSLSAACHGMLSDYLKQQRHEQ